MSDEEDRDVDIESDADKRAHHNALERKRRDHIKDSFSSLRDSVPSLHGEKSSRAQILKKAAEYIHFMRRKNTSHQQDIDDLKRQNKVLEEQTVGTMERAKTNGTFSSTAMLESANHVNNRGDVISAFDGGSGSESSELEDDDDDEDDDEDDDDDDDLPEPLPPSRKKLKTSSGMT